MRVGDTVTLAIAAPVRGEEPYLIEWIAYHRVLGIDAFILGDNGGDDGTSALLEALHRAHLIIRLDWRDAKRFHLEFMAQALAVARLFAHGLFFIDVDEFLFLEEPETSMAALAGRWLADATVGAVALNWAIYGSSNRDDADAGLVIERFQHRGEQRFGVNRHVKPFVRVAACPGPDLTPHAVRLSAGRYVSSDGADVVWDIPEELVGLKAGITRDVVWTGARVNHYVLKSRAEFTRKRRRGAQCALTEQQRLEDEYWRAHDRNECRDPPPDWLLDATKREMERIRSLLNLP